MKTIIITIILLLIIGCKQNRESRIDSYRFIVKTQDKQYLGVNDYAEIVYRPDIMDTLKLQEHDFRKVYFKYSIFNEPQKQNDIISGEFDHYYSALEDKDSVIPFRIKLNKLGERWVEGFVIDSIFLNNYYKNGEGRLISRQVRVQRKIIGIEKK